MRCDTALVTRELMQTAKVDNKAYNFLSECLICPNCSDTYFSAEQCEVYNKKIKVLEVYNNRLKEIEDEASECEEAEESSHKSF